jgi:hypothetical protein
MAELGDHLIDNRVVGRHFQQEVDQPDRRLLTDCMLPRTLTLAWPPGRQSGLPRPTPFRMPAME